jgi:orotidine-5'-phosphate decarboxylase
LGRDALAPFLERTDKLSIVLCRTSNPDAREFQDLQVEGRPLWEIVADTVASKWNQHGNCALVVGATVPDQLRRVRARIGEMWVLVPGVGAQGGSVEETLSAGLDVHGRGLLINASRSIIFAEHPDVEAQTLRDQINRYRS